MGRSTATANQAPGRGSVVPAGVKAYPISPRSPETKAPDQKKLDRYVRLYGSEGLSETMDDYGIQGLPLNAYATNDPEGRRMTPELATLIRELDGRGFVTDSVAKTLNLKLARVKRVLAETPLPAAA